MLPVVTECRDVQSRRQRCCGGACGTLNSSVWSTASVVDEADPPRRKTQHSAAAAASAVQPFPMQQVRVPRRARAPDERGAVLSTQSQSKPQPLPAERTRVPCNGIEPSARPQRQSGTPAEAAAPTPSDIPLAPDPACFLTTAAVCMQVAQPASLLQEPAAKRSAAGRCASRRAGARWQRQWRKQSQGQVRSLPRPQWQHRP